MQMGFYRIVYRFNAERSRYQSRSSINEERRRIKKLN